MAIASAVLTGIQTADRIARVAKPGTRLEESINNKYGESGGPWWAKGLRAVGKFAREKFGWGVDGRHIYHGHGSLPELCEAVRAAVLKVHKLGKAPAKYRGGPSDLEAAVKDAIDSISVALVEERGGKGKRRIARKSKETAG